MPDYIAPKIEANARDLSKELYHNRKSLNVVIDGVDGVGKTTVLSIFKELYGYDVVPSWGERDIEQSLKSHILDPANNIPPLLHFAATAMFQGQRCKKIKSLFHTPVILSDRGWLSCFMYAWAKSGYTDEMLHALLRVMDLDNYAQPDLVIWLSCSKMTAAERIKDRSGEYFKSQPEEDRNKLVERTHAVLKTRSIRSDSGPVDVDSSTINALCGRSAYAYVVTNNCTPAEVADKIINEIRIAARPHGKVNR